MTGVFRINPLEAVYADRQRFKGIGSTAAQKVASQHLLAAAVDPTLDSAGDPREPASSGLMLKGLPNYKPDISHATKSGHFNLLRTEVKKNGPFCRLLFVTKTSRFKEPCEATNSGV